jgi:hypothetical protein
MRDPDLVVRAQRAATALESAWCRWRNMHGLAADPAPPVSSYVGYSLDAPWGQPRVVLGLCAEEAEQLAVLLDRHDCVGPVHASVTAKPAGQAEDGAPGAPAAGQVPAGLLRVPPPAPASAGQQPLSASSGLSRTDSRPGAAPPRRRDTGPSPLTSPSVPDYPDLETPIAAAASRAVEASMTSKKKAVNGTPVPRADRSGEVDRPGGEQAGEHATGDDHPDPGAHPAPAGGPQAAAGASGGHPADDDPAAAVTAIGGLPAVPAGVEPFFWAGGLARDGVSPASPAAATGPGPATATPGGTAAARGGQPGRPGENPGGMRPGQSGPERYDTQEPGGSEIVAFRPRSEPGAEPGRLSGGAGRPGAVPDSTGPSTERLPATRPDSRPATAGGQPARGSGAGSGDRRADAPVSARPGPQAPWGPGQGGSGQGGPWTGDPGHGAPGHGAPGHGAPGRGGSYPAAEHQQPASPAEREPASREATEVRHPAGDPSRPNRVMRSGSLARLKRSGPVCETGRPGASSQRPAPSATPAPAPPRDGQARMATPASADAATWASGELPGQAAVSDKAR